MRATLTAVLAIASSVGVAVAMPVPAGSCLCTVEDRAGIGRTHVESDPGPEAFVDDSPTYRFRINVTDDRDEQRIVETAYEGPGRSLAEWHTPHSTLHAPYVGAEGVLRATEDMGFLKVGVQDATTRRIWFYHSAFEYPGGEDVVLSVRYGHCDPE